MIDINKTIDLVKLKFYNEWLYATHIYSEGESNFHKQLTEKVITTYIDPLNLPKNSLVMDLGCGPGYFLDDMKSKGYSNLVGVSLSPEDITLCRNKGHVIKEYDMSFLPQADGYYDESVDFIFLRHSLEHSPYPIFSLMEYNRVLKQHGFIYIETPAPDCDRLHEYNLNHYSILGQHQLAALLKRTGFELHKFDVMEFDLTFPDKATVKELGKDTAVVPKKAEPAKKSKSKKTVEEEQTIMREKFYCVLASKQRPIDVK